MEKVLQEHFWEHLFWVPILFKWYQNTFRCDTASFICFEYVLSQLPRKGSGIQKM